MTMSIRRLLDWTQALSNVCVYAVHTTIRKGRQFTGLSTFESMFRPCGRGEEIEEQALARGMEEFYFTFYGDKSQTMTVEKKNRD